MSKHLRPILKATALLGVLAFAAPASSQDPRTKPGPAEIQDDGVCYNCSMTGGTSCPCQILEPQDA